jgi:hypothetical protein
LITGHVSKEKLRKCEREREKCRKENTIYRLAYLMFVMFMFVGVYVCVCVHQR